MKHYDNKKILIIGASGFIGEKLYSYLLNVIGCTNVFATSRAEKSQRNWFQCDIKNKVMVEELLLQINPDIIFHLAADINPSRSILDFEEIMETNIIGTTNILSSIQKNKLSIDCFINIGSCEEYGFIDQPFIEEKMPSPISIYSGTKAAATILCKMFFNLYNIPIITVRPSLIYGPGQKERFFIHQAITSLLAGTSFDMSLGEQTRDFLFIEDLIRALIEISKMPSLAGEIINVSSGQEYSLKQVIQLIQRLTNSSSSINIGALPYRETEIMSFSCNNEKILNLTNWRPIISLEEGLKRTIEYHTGGSIE
ncbi:NAD-dependent epimerase/dehydratase family protein [Paenibacillus allorhizosphaerae]|uniref:GDP-6-deoxy-D-mannose reductase n=1 Tax=Paenibacillus allorhizosphaerae TaxID=2849866 RepID=A0ABM8VV43_9BACL|nr:NAD(P)-dependent oxidoreductase [Paenibacillus allorhizosphaerae]CAG7659207.1 GDP-6-deoxy-D-mannose reductase [Paenibacillus allorhizosphaerae]